MTMRYRLFGRTGLQVSVVGFGCWPMAGDRYGAIEDDEAVKAIHRALDRGVNCVDTAPAYGAGHSEDVVARALEKRRGEVLRSEEHTSELQSRFDLVCRLLLEKKR